ncbi:MAG: hypothetical protein AAFV53_22830 [Myxococcota bacterium]
MRLFSLLLLFACAPAPTPQAPPPTPEPPVVEHTPRPAPSPVVDSETGQAAFDDLAVWYAGGAAPDTDAALSRLADGDAGSGAYLAALLAQLRDDESNGRGSWRASPFWGGGSTSDARELRAQIAAALAATDPAPPALLPAARFLLLEEPIPAHQQHGLSLLSALPDAETAPLLAELLDPPHPNQEILLGAITLAQERDGHADALDALRSHHRSAVRAAVGGDPQPAKTLPAGIIAELEGIREMLFTDLPADAAWISAGIQEEWMRNGEPVVTPTRCWVVAEDTDTVTVMTWFAEEKVLPQERLVDRVERDPLADAQELIAVRQGDDRDAAMDILSRAGGLTGQFEAGYVSLPEGLLAAWLLARGEEAAAAALILPRIEAAADDRWVGWVLRDALGHHYHQQMLIRFSHHRDYTGAIALADHLSSERFIGYQYHERAVEVADQLRRRSDDFRARALPTPAAWAATRATLSREAQIEHLLDRLRLLNAIQWGQPGGVDYNEAQFDTPIDGRDPEASTALLNPFTALRAMDLAPADIPTLLPALEDDDFMVMFSYWRDFHPDRSMHRVRDAVAWLINEAAEEEVVHAHVWNHPDPARRQPARETVEAWLKENLSQSSAARRRTVIAETADWYTLSNAAEKAIEAGERDILPALAGRLGDFKDRDGSLLALMYRLNTPDARPLAAEWLQADEDSARVWAALILLQQGQPDAALPILEDYLQQPAARLDRFVVPVLLDSGSPKARALACALPETPGYAEGYLNAQQWDQRSFPLHALFAAGCAEVVPLLRAGLQDTTPIGQVSGMRPDGTAFTYEQLRADQIAYQISEWRVGEGDLFDNSAPDEERAEMRVAVLRWVEAQHANLTEGRPHEIAPAPAPTRETGWFIDAPR